MPKDVRVVLPKGMCLGKIEIVTCVDATEATVTVTDACPKPAAPPDVAPPAEGDASAAAGESTEAEPAEAAAGGDCAGAEAT